MHVELILSFVITMIIATMLVPLVNKAGEKLAIVAKKNERTVHVQEVTRIGGYAIYLSFLVGTVVFLKTDPQINAILIGGFLVFMVGLYDDIHDLSPKIKIIVELIAAVIVINYGGISLQGFDALPPIVLSIITIIWIIGITNAINLIDGLDGLSAGISIIVLITISLTSLTSGRTDIAALSLTLAGAIMGFLFYNFHPAKIFMGDSGALFVGFMISVISLLGFGYNVSTFFTLGAPIVVLMVPIMDTLIAIVRRKVHKKKFSQADRRHLHHNLMFKLKLGHTKSVLVLYAITILFSLTSYVYLYDAKLGILMFIILMFCFEVFVELTNMIGRKYKPLLTILNIFIRSKHLPKVKTIERYLARKTPEKKRKERMIVVCILLVVCVITGYFMLPITTTNKKTVTKETPYVLISEENELLKDTYHNLDRAYQNNQKEEEAQLVAVYFGLEYLSFKEHPEDIGGLEYIYPNQKEDFKEYAAKSYYQNRSLYPSLEVNSYQIVSFSPSKVTITGLEDNKYYNVLVSFALNQEVEDFNTTINIIVVLVEDRYYVVGVDDI